MFILFIKNNRLVFSLVFCVILLILSNIIQAVTPGDCNCLTLAPMLEKVTPAVVNISTENHVTFHNPLLNDPFFRRFFDIPEQPQEHKAQSVGSGVVVDAAHGYVITNQHVIEGANKINVTLRDGRKFSAKIIGADRESDVAVIQIFGKDLIELPLADSDNMRVGDFVVAIGNPFGLGQTVTSGIVSALGRSGLGIQGYEDFIQTDASINPGNSGGALVNLHGELVGINTAIIAPGGGNVGIGFAIPANMVARTMHHIIAHGGIHRGYLGIAVQDLTPELARAFNIINNHGAIVSEVIPNSPAARAGMSIGDVILSLNNKQVRSSSSIHNAIGLMEVGDKVQLDILRNGNQQTISTTIGEYLQVEGSSIHMKLSGAKLTNNSGQTHGILVTSVQIGSPAAHIGLYENDLILGINHYPVSNIDVLKKIATIINHDKKIIINILRGREELLLLAEK